MEVHPLHQDDAALRALLHRWAEALGGVAPAHKTHKSSRDGLRYWWFRTRHGSNQPFHETGEALALLAAVRRVDVRFWTQHVEAMTPSRFRASLFGARGLVHEANERVEIGLRPIIISLEELEPISECVLAVRAPSPAFLEDYAYLKARSDTVEVDETLGGVPVSLHLAFADSDPEKGASILSQILELVIAQQALQTGVIDAEVASRFRIVEIRFSCSNPRLTVNAEALEYLAQLCQRGIRVRDLPPIRDADESLSTRLSIAASLENLISSSQDFSATQCRPQHVYISEDTSPHIIPLIYSGVQTSTSIKHVYLQAKGYPNGVLTPPQADVRRLLWRWAAYALFSRHAQHRIKSVHVHGSFFDDDGIESIRDLLTIENPLGGLFDGDPDRRQQPVWLRALRLYATPPSPDGSSFDGYELKSCTDLRVIDAMKQSGEKWWRVLVPGHGVVWVSDSDAELREPHAAYPETSSTEEFQLEFVDILESDQEAISSLLSMVHRDVTGLDFDPSSAGYLFDGLLSTVLSRCPQLETLKLPPTASLQGLSEVVTCAAAANGRLRRLDVGFALNVASTDVNEFLDLLCDPTHPLARSLHELKLNVAFDKDSKEAFVRHVREMLASNRQIYSFHLVVPFNAAELDLNTDKPVAIRTAPLDIRSKLAFISVVPGLNSNPVGNCLDSCVMSIVFAFAAQHRLREVLIEREH